MARAAPLVRKDVRAEPARGRAPPLQAKLDIAPARDRYEVEADRIADRVMSNGAAVQPAAPPVISRLPAPGAQRAAETATGPAKPKVRRPAPPNAQEAKTRKVEDEEEDESTTFQRSAEGPVAAPAGAERSIARMRASGGQPLERSVRQHLEPVFGRSLSAVRVHNDAGAHAAAKAVGARAFTVGSDVFFGAGRYRPGTPAGRRLLAHEIVHTEQQKGLGGVAQAMALQRQEEDETAGAGEEPEGPGLMFDRRRPAGRLELSADGRGGRVFLPFLKIPRILGATKGVVNHPKGPGVNDDRFNPLQTGTPFVYKGKNPRGSDTAAETLRRSQYMEESDQQLEPVLLTLFPGKVRNWDRAADVQAGETGEKRYYLRLQGERASRANSIIIGTQAELAEHAAILLPTWNREGRFHRFDVDHAQELQLGGFDGWRNFWLLDQEANQSSGRNIDTNLRSDIMAVVTAAREAEFFTGPNAGKAPSFDDFKDLENPWTAEFARFQNLPIDGGNDYWSRAELVGGKHLENLRAMTTDEVAAEGLIIRGDPPGRPSFVSVFAKPNGGFRRRFTVREDGVTPDRGNENLFLGFDLVSADVTADPAAPPYITRLNGWAFRRRRGSPLNPTLIGGDRGIPVLAAHGLGYSGYLDQGALMARIREIPTEIVGASPVQFDEAGITNDGVIFANGRITATKLLFPGVEIPIRVRGTDIFIEFPIPTERLNFGPVRVTEAALMLGVGDGGIFVEGSAALAVDSVGSGLVNARVERGNTILSGDFDFDVDFLDPARAAIVYDYGADMLTLSLTAGVKEGALPGVVSGEVTATFSRESVAISGALNLGGLLQGTVVSVSYSPEEGVALGADDIPLPVERLPGISSATASLHARRNPDTGEWSFGGAGRAEVAIAGATGSIDVTVDGDKVTVGGDLAVAKGPAAGSISFTATNAPMDDEGNIVEGDAQDSYTVFGRGQAEITFGRVLKGSAAITLSPDASIQIEGTIGLPPTFEVFPKQEFNKSLLTIETPDFPIWGISLGGVGIGIFAFADAELSFNAFIGPGELRDTQVTATMDLDVPEDAVVTGSARFFVPAGAGLMLDIGGGLRARVAVAFAEGRVGLDGELGIEADASAGVTVNWNRTDGLSVEADVEANARPKFRVGVNARVRAGVDLYLTEITKTWGPWRKTLGEFGPDMEMGVKVPVKWNETDGIDFSLDDIEVKQPRIDPKAILKSAFEELV